VTPGPPTPADVEISIVNHQNRAMVRECLLSLPAACEGVDAVITVIDNVSNDGSLEMLAKEFPGVRVIANTRRLGFGPNHNQVLRRVVSERSARSVLVLNDDTVLEPGSVARLVAALDADPALGMVAPSVTNPAVGRLPTRFTYPTLWHSFLIDAGRRGGEDIDADGWLQGACLLLRVDAVADIGGFDPRFFLFFEDCDLSLRLGQHGWRLAEVDDAQILHFAHQSVLREDFADFTPKQGLRSRYLYFAKHAGPRRAQALSVAGRGALLARALAARARSLRGDAAARAAATRLLALARYNPRRPLAPELAAGPPEPL
jgi:GT2 family glycosyltransferase